MALSTIKTNSIDDSAITNAKIANTTIDVTAKITGAVPVANGGTALTSIGSANREMTVNSASALEFSTIKSQVKNQFGFHQCNVPKYNKWLRCSCTNRIRNALNSKH